MRSRTIQILAAVTLLVAVAAALALKNREAHTTAAAAQGESLFPELRSKVNDVASVTVKGASSGFTVERKDKSWGAADKGGYPVEFDKVKELVVGISEFAVVERMTADPARHAKLSVQDPTAADAESKQVTLKDSGGSVLADVVIGKTRDSRGGGGKPTLYVRKAGDNQTFEVTGQLTVDDQLTNWLDKEIAKLDKKRVHRVVVHHADGTELALSKATLEEENFTVENLPEGAELSWPGVANGVAGALEWLNLEDVKPALEVDLSGEVTTTTFTTFDGLVLTALTLEKDEKVYLKLSAAFDESARVEPIGPTPPADATSEDPNAPPPEDPPAGKTADEVRKEVETLNAKVQPWAYIVPGYGAANLRKKLDELLKKPEPEAPAGDEFPPIDEGADDMPILDEVTPPPVEEEKPAETPPETPPEETPPQETPPETPPGG